VELYRSLPICLGSPEVGATNYDMGMQRPASVDEMRLRRAVTNLSSFPGKVGINVINMVLPGCLNYGHYRA